MPSVGIAASSSGDNTVVAGVAGKAIRVLAFALSFSGSVNGKFTDGESGTLLAGLFYGAAGIQVDMPMSPTRVSGPTPYFQTAAGNDLVLNLSTNTAVGGLVVYDILPV